MKAKIRMVGIRDVQRNVKMFEITTRYKLQQQLITSARNIAKSARRRAPKKTGQLRKSIVVKFNKQKTMAYVRATARYSHIVENGSASRGIAPRPFFQPAVEAETPRYVSAITDILK